jgi:hypothetical protein
MQVTTNHQLVIIRFAFHLFFKRAVYKVKSIFWKKNIDTEMIFIGFVFFDAVLRNNGMRPHKLQAAMKQEL